MKTTTLSTVLFLLLCYSSTTLFGQNPTNEDILRDHGVFVKETSIEEDEFINNKFVELLELEQLVDTIVTYSYLTAEDSTLSEMIINDFNDLRQIIVTTGYVYIDSISAWQFSSKSNTEYDSYGNWVMKTYENWSVEDTAFINLSKVVYSFNEIGEKLLYELWRWDTELSQWYGYFKYVYEYNENGDKTFEQKWSWSTDLFDWINSYYIDDEYNEFGRTHHEHWKWDTDNSIWYGYMLSDRYYNSLGNDTLYLTYTWADNDWLMLWKYETIFDNDGNRIQTLMYSWNSEIEEFENMRKTIYEYNPFGEYTLMIASDWDDVLLEYVDSRKWIREFSETGMVLYWHYSTWSDTKRGWIPSWKSEYEYDDNDYETESAKWKWDSANNIWYGDFMSTHSYDPYGNIISYFMYWWSSEMTDWEGYSGYYSYFDNDGFLNLVINYDWDDELFDWHLNTKDFYYYRITVGVNEVVDQIFTVYPNPTTDFLKIDYRSKNEIDVQLITLSGCPVIIKSNFTPGNVIDISNLSSGIYVLWIYDGTIKTSKKIIIK